MSFRLSVKPICSKTSSIFRFCAVDSTSDARGARTTNFNFEPLIVAGACGAGGTHKDFTFVSTADTRCVGGGARKDFDFSFAAGTSGAEEEVFFITGGASGGDEEVSFSVGGTSDDDEEVRSAGVGDADEKVSCSVGGAGADVKSLIFWIHRLISS